MSFHNKRSHSVPSKMNKNRVTLRHRREISEPWSQTKYPKSFQKWVKKKSLQIMHQNMIDMKFPTDNSAI